MRAMIVTCSLNKVGKDTLDVPLERKVKVAVPDDFNCTPNDWLKIFAAWPTSKEFMREPKLQDVIIEGLKTLARRETVAIMVKEYRASHGGNGKRGRPNEMVFEDIKPYKK